jgi:hypothetical protein
LDDVLLWGRVEGITRDYYVVRGHIYNGDKEFPKTTYFWSGGSEFNFSPLPLLKEEFIH